ncbi:MAG: substrate-binding domain-containing protein [Planctomycetes bacterium]|nr:substrate-binding domain-containing protein [Planctomycetota bacterium]
MRFRITLLPLLGLLCGALFVGVPGCTPAEEDTSSTGNAGVIGFSALTLKNPFFKIIADSVTEEAEANGMTVIVNDAEKDVNTQSKHIENYIAQKVSAIIINPADRIAVGPAIRKANEAGIPVFTCDLQCTAEDIEIAGHIGTDNFQGGRLAGEAMIEVLGESGGEVLILHFKQANSCVLRVKGFMEVIDAHNQGKATGKVTVVAELDGGGLKDEGYKATSDALQAHPSLSGVFAINDPSALGAYRALKQANKVGQITIIGFDGQLEGKQAILEGKIYADPIQFPKQMGRVSVHNIIAHRQGNSFEKTILIPTQIYKKADAENDPELKAAGE